MFQRPRFLSLPNTLVSFMVTQYCSASGKLKSNQVMAPGREDGSTAF